jgi:hypothetical protein
MTDRPDRPAFNHSRGDSPLTPCPTCADLIAQEEESPHDRLVRLVREFFEMRDKFNTHWKDDPNCVGARFVAGQIERIEGEMRAAVEALNG